MLESKNSMFNKEDKMQKEIISQKTCEYSVNISANKVDSLRKVVENATTIRVYENGFVGIAGQLGEVDINELEKLAIENLSNKVPYPCDLTKNVVKSVDSTTTIIDKDEFVKTCQHLVKRISAECPDFLFSNKIKYYEKESDYQNSVGTHLSYKGNYMSFTVIIKNKNTANIMDMAYFDQIKDYNEDNVVEDIKLLCDTFNKDASVDDGKYKVITMDSMFISNAAGPLVGEMYANQASLFKGKLNEQILNDNLSILKKESFKTSFFDAEGTMLDDDNRYLVKDGVFVATLSNKKVAKQYGLPRIPCSSASYDSAPAIAGEGIRASVTAKSLNDIIGNDKAILIVEASGGDMTTSGDWATPVQMSFLIEGGKLVGKLPPLNATANLFDLLGKDYLGTTESAFLNTQNMQYMVANVNITKI